MEPESGHAAPRVEGMGAVSNGGVGNDLPSEYHAEGVKELPYEITMKSSWVGWRLDGDDKCPINPHNGKKAKVNDRTTWGTLEQALDGCTRYDLAGIGFVFDRDATDLITGIDIDHCREPDGSIALWAQEIIRVLNSYTERSPSGTGFHIFVLGKLPTSLEHHRLNIGSGRIEVYDGGRFFTMTGDHVEETPRTIERRQDELEFIVHKWGLDLRDQPSFNGTVRKGYANAADLDDDALIEKALGAANGEKFGRLFVDGNISEYDGDDSSADLALVNLLAFWTNGDRLRVDRLFRRSRLMRAKWNRALRDTAYGWWTIDKALANGAPGSETQSDTQAHDLYCAATLLDLQLPPVRWTVNDILPEGLILLSGKPKLGKSWLALSVALAVAHGQQALGRYDAQQGDVLFLALEDNKRRFQSRLRKLCGPPGSAGPYAGRPERLMVAHRWGALDKGGVAAIERWVREHPAARLIVIDTLVRLRPMRRANADAYVEDSKMMTPLQEFAGKYGVTILVVHHNRKQESDDPLDLISGTLGLSGTVDAVWVLRRDRGNMHASLFVTGRDIQDETDLALSWDAATCCWRVLGEAHEYRQSLERLQICQLLRQSKEPLAPKDIAEELGKNASTTRVLLRAMVRSNTLVSTKGRYSLNTVNSPNGET